MTIAGKQHGNRWTRARARLLLAVALVAMVATAGEVRPALATIEGDIVYTVYQAPPAGSVLQVGSSLTFRVDVTSGTPAGGFPGPVTFDLRKPTNFSYQSFGVEAGNIIGSCADNVPAPGYVRCTVGLGGSVSTVGNSSAAEVVVNLTADAAAAGTAYDDAAVRSLFASSGFRNAGDAPDGVGSDIGENDSLDASVGGITVANILGANTNISVTTAANPLAIFEGALTTVTVTFAHSLPAFGATLQPIDVNVTNGDIQNGSISCPGGTGTATVLAGTARCTGSSVTNGSSMSFNVRARDTASGDDMAVTVIAPSLGLSQGEAAASGQGVATTTVAVDEVGLETVSLPGAGSASPPWAAGPAIAVCTAGVGSDVSDDRAAGAAQAAPGVAGTAWLTPAVPLAAADFGVTGPGGTVGFTYLDSGAANCGAGQSGVQFTPSIPGSYAVTAYYNGDTVSSTTRAATYGTNTLVVAVQTTNPVPSVGSLSPTGAGAGGPGFPLSVNGSGFIAGSVVRWNGADRPTSFVSATQLTATVSASDIANQGAASVSVRNPAPGGGTSAGTTFNITGAPNPAPTMGSVTPSAAPAGSPAFTITVNGANFVNGSTVRWNGADRATTFINATQLTANVLAGDLATAGSANVQVSNPAPGGGTSLAATFTINAAAAPAPSVTSLSPAAATAGGAAFTLTVTGANLTPSSTVRWAGSDRTTTFVSATQITAAIPATDIATAGSVSVTVQTAAQASTALAFAVNNPVPAITELSPDTKPAGAQAFTLTVTGTGFVSGSKVRWNGSERPTTYMSATSLTAEVTGADVASKGTAKVMVVNPAPGGGTSAEEEFAVGTAAPVKSDQVVVAAPAVGAMVARSRLTFSVTTGTLATPSAVTFVIRRVSDGKYWDGATSTWGTALAENTATVDGTGRWQYAVSGAARRLFVATAVTVEARATIGGAPYTSATTPEVRVR